MFPAINAASNSYYKFDLKYLPFYITIDLLGFCRED